jgi:hypothetical protein
VSIQSVAQLVFGFHPEKPIVVETSRAQLSSDAGLLPIRQFDEQIGFTRQFAAALLDTRDPALLIHTRRSMVVQRIYGILADYEDQNDHDTLRSDPIFKLLADRLPDEDDLASQPTLSRFENAVTIPDLYRLRDVLVDQFVQSFEVPPVRLTLDFDAFDDPTHGQQQLTFFHGYYKQYQYLPLGEGHPCTWRARLIKVAAEVLVSSRRVLVRLSSSWPHLDHFASVSQAILALDTG